MRKPLLITLYLFAFCLPSKVFALTDVFINPSVPGTPFWDRVSDVVKTAANDLNIKLTIIYGRDNRILHHQSVREVATYADKPDYVIMSAYGKY